MCIGPLFTLCFLLIDAGLHLVMRSENACNVTLRAAAAQIFGIIAKS